MDPGPSLWLRGKQEIRRGFDEMFALPGSAELSTHDRTYRAKGNVGYSMSLFTLTMKDAGGRIQEIHGRASTVYEKRAGKWLAVVDHASVPLPPPAPSPAPAPGR